MLTVKTPEEALNLITDAIPSPLPAEDLAAEQACGRVLAEPVTAREYVPGFDRSTVDGYAVSARDTFGCSDSIPALLTLQGEVLMGEQPAEAVQSGSCRYVPTGGAVPPGADAVVMLEYAEVYDSTSVGIAKPVAPGENIIYRGDDVSPGQEVLSTGYRLEPHDIGALAAMGITQVSVRPKPVVGILSTGDELVPPHQIPGPGQIRDVNAPMLTALMNQLGAQSLPLGILPDNEDLLLAAVTDALKHCDMLLVSGGSSVGTKDATATVIARLGEVLFHGIAIKPGKPTIFGLIDGKPVFGLPGHPVAAYFVSRVFVRAALNALTGRAGTSYTMPATLTQSVSANHGRAQYVGVRLTCEQGAWFAHPIRSKSGLITGLAASDGFFCIPRDSEGLAQGETVAVTRYHTD